MKYERFLFYIYITLLFWLPLPLGSNRPWSWNLFEICTFVLCISWLVLFLRNRVEFSGSYKKSQLYFLPLLIFVAIIVIQLVPNIPNLLNIAHKDYLTNSSSDFKIISVDPHITVSHLRLTIAFLALSFITLNLANSLYRVKVVLSTLVISGVTQAIFASLLVLPGSKGSFLADYFEIGGFASGTFWSRNHLANYLMLSLSCGVGLLLADQRSNNAISLKFQILDFLTTLLSSKALIRISLAIMVIALVLTKSRMGNIAFFSSFILTSFIWMIFTKSFSKGIIILLISVLMVDVLIIGKWFGIEEVKQRLETTSRNTESRDEVVRDGLSLLSDSPILGTGAGTFYTAFPKVRQKDIDLYYDHAHNDYLEIAVEYGIAGLAILGTLIFSSLYRIYWALKFRRSTVVVGYVFTPLMAIIGMLIHSAVDFSLQLTANAATFIVVLSLAWVLPNVASRSNAK